MTVSEESAVDRATSMGEADTLLGAAFRAQPVISEPFYASLAYNQARVALALGDLRRADSLSWLDLKWAGASGRYHTVVARVAAARGDRATAEAEGVGTEMVSRCQTLPGEALGDGFYYACLLKPDALRSPNVSLAQH